MDAEKLIKCLELTASDSDGECLAAIRAANKILKREGKRWADIISDGQPYYGKDPYENIRKKTKEYTETRDTYTTWFESLFDLELSPKTTIFISSIYEYYLKNGRLTDKQAEALERIYKESCFV